VRSRRNTILFVSLFCTACLFFLIDILTGSVHIPLVDIVQIFLGNTPADDAYSIIIIQTRLPKSLTAVAVGAGLPVAGLLMQTYFRNPVAGPDILGISAGSGLFVAIVMLGAGNILAASVFYNVSVIFAAIVGAVCMLLIILTVARKTKDNITLLMFAIFFGMAVSAVVGILQFYSDKGDLKLFILWTFGSLGGVTWQQLTVLLPVIIVCCLLTFLLAKRLNVLLIGEKYAKNLGLHIRHTTLVIILLTALITGAVTAFCGPVAFIGLAVPHAARMLFKTSDHSILIPASILTGISILLFCDVLTQMAAAGVVLPLNSITALMGAPFVIYILWKNYKMQYFF